MTIPAALHQAREAMLCTLTDDVQLLRVTGTTTDALGTEHDDEQVVWSGAGLVQDLTSGRQQVVLLAGERDADTTPYVVKLPLSCPVAPDDYVKVVASLTPGHVGRRWRVTSVPTQGWQVLQRCPCDIDERSQP